MQRSLRPYMKTVCRSLKRLSDRYRIYRADDVAADMKIRNQLREWEAAGFGHLPICMAKTQYSFSTDPILRGAPTGHIVPVREVRLSAGAGFVGDLRGYYDNAWSAPNTCSTEHWSRC